MSLPNAMVRRSIIDVDTDLLELKLLCARSIPCTPRVELLQEDVCFGVEAKLLCCDKNGCGMQS